MHDLAAPVLDSPSLRRYGLPELVYGTAPAAGADFVQELGGAFHTRLISLFCLLTPSADVAAREVVLEYRNAADERFALAGAPVTVPASDVTSFFFSAYLGEPDWETDSTVLVPLAPLLLPPTFDFRIHVVNMDNTDTLTQIRFVWERFYSDVDLT